MKSFDLHAWCIKQVIETKQFYGEVSTEVDKTYLKSVIFNRRRVWNFSVYQIRDVTNSRHHNPLE